MLVKRRILSTVIAATALLAALITASFVAAGMIDKDLSRITEEQTRIDEQYALRRLLRGSSTDLTATKGRVGTLSQAAVREGGELAFIRALEGAAAASGVTQDIQLETANQTDLSAWEKQIPLTLRLTGPYPRVLRHINALERLPYAISVQLLSIDAQALNDPTGAVRAIVNAKVYWIGSSSPDFVRGQDEGRTVTLKP